MERSTGQLITLHGEDDDDSDQPSKVQPDRNPVENGEYANHCSRKLSMNESLSTRQTMVLTPFTELESFSPPTNHTARVFLRSDTINSFLRLQGRYIH